MICEKAIGLGVHGDTVDVDLPEPLKADGVDGPVNFALTDAKGRRRMVTRPNPVGRPPQRVVTWGILLSGANARGCCVIARPGFRCHRASHKRTVS